MLEDGHKKKKWWKLW